MTTSDNDSQRSFAKLEAFFHELHELDETRRAQRLREIGDTQPELAKRLMALLEPANDALLPDTLRGDPDSEASDETKPPGVPDLVGPYRVLRVLGSGGMGIVLEAHQCEPVDRRVAIKLVRAGLDTRRVLERFDRERRALAVMNHPNIARVFDAGSAEGGRPYFVMELVDGCSITEYCDRHKLRTAERLDLFAVVCEAVQHAHRKGLIHRDLKPSNLMVTEIDGRPVIKVIDFGIAKATSEDTLPQLVTRAGEMVGTPEFMSPEQARGDEIDTRSDVYSLGVVLFELLVGELPFLRGSPSVRSSQEDSRRMAKSSAPRPSSRLLEDRAQATDVARRRRTDPNVLARSLRGDLDWIVLKALASEPDDRYGSASELAADIERHRRNEPVIAGPPTLGYRARKLFRRHRVAVVATAAVLVSLVVGLGATSVGLVRTRQAEDEARAQAKHAEEVTAFLENLLVSADPRQHSEEPTLRDVLDEGAHQLRDGLADQPLVRARLLGVVASTYGHLGDGARAVELARAAEESLSGVAEIGPLERAQLLLGWAKAHAYDNDPEAARARLDDVLALVEPPEGPEATEIRLDALLLLGTVLGMLERREEAIATLESVLREARALDHVDPGIVPDTLYNLASNHLELGRVSEAHAAIAAATDAWRSSLGPGHVDTATGLLALGVIETDLRRYAEAEEHLVEALRVLEGRYGADSPQPQLVLALTNLANLMYQTGREDDALQLNERAVALCRTQERPPQDVCPMALNNLGTLYLDDSARHREGAALTLEAIRVWETVYGPEFVGLVIPLTNLADSALKGDDLEQASELAARAAAILDGNVAGDERERLYVDTVLARIEAARGREPAARERYERAFARIEASEYRDDAEVARSQRWYAQLLLGQGEVEQAVGELSEAVARLESVLPPSSSDLAAVRQELELARARLDG